ncbi:uncharacterized protein [Venturia canescens]|uniref:uncharacterized protein n=1 Tax=Venturia canescens TaxID=32260 RepID=UPI001C9D4D31|nr:uncharacterized protein LOC122411657 [Venturia canescens]
MPKRGADVEESRAKVCKVQQDIAEIVPESDSGELTSASVRAVPALKKDEENKENVESSQSSPGKVSVDPEIVDTLGIEVNKDKDEATVIDKDLVEMCLPCSETWL